MIVSHDRSFLNTVCTDIIHLHSKRLDQYKGNYAVFEKTMKEKLTQQERFAIFLVQFVFASFH